MYICWIKARTKIKNAVFRRCFCVRSTPLIIWIKSVSKKHFIKKFTIKNLDLLVSVISFSTRPCSLTAAAHLEQTTRTHWWFWQKDDPCFHTITWRCYKNCSIKEYAEEEKKNAAGAPEMHQNVHLGDYWLFSFYKIKNTTQAERIFEQNCKRLEKKRSDDEKAPRNIRTTRLLRRLTE